MAGKSFHDESNIDLENLSIDDFLEPEPVKKKAKPTIGPCGDYSVDKQSGQGELLAEAVGIGKPLKKNDTNSTKGKQFYTNIQKYITMR